MKKTTAKIYRTVYNTFKGADFSTDPSLVDKSRSPLCTNIVADAGGMPQKRCGWRSLHRLEGRVNGLFAATFSGTVKRLAHVGTKLYLWDESSDTPAQLLTGLPDRKSRAAFLGGRLWIVTGGGFYVYDGTDACRVEDYDGTYVPLIIITREPAGGGITYESVNMMTPYRKEGFQTDGASVTFQLSGSIDETGDVKCWVWGEEVNDFTADRANGTVTFSTAPAAPPAGSADGLVVQYPHTITGYAEYINQCTICTTYGVGNNDRLVVSGNKYFPNIDWISGLDDPTYIPDLGYATVGSEATAICGYCRVGDQLGIVKTDDGHDSTIFLRSAVAEADGSVNFSLSQAIAGVGAVAEGSFASLMDDPLFLSRTGVTAIASNAVTSEKITQGRSYFVNPRLTAEPELTEAEACVWNGMYLLALPDGHVYGLDARQDKTYKSGNETDFVYECCYWENVPARCWLVRKDGTSEDLYFGTADGRICKFNADLTTTARFTDDGGPIDAVWATKYDDDGTPAVLKTMLKRGCCVTIKPYARSSGAVYFRSDRTLGTERRTAGGDMNILDFSDVDFERFTFNADDSAREIFLNRKVKNYKRLQIIVRNSEPGEGFGVFQITKHYVIGNYAKR